MAANDKEQPSRVHTVTRSLAKKALAPLAASAAAYAARKLPELYEKQVAPKLRERGGTRAVVEDAAQRVGTQLQDAKEKVSDATEKVSTKVAETPILPTGGGSKENAGGGNGNVSDGDRDEARQKRRQNRQARRAST